MRERFVVDTNAPESVTDLARQVEIAFERVEGVQSTGPYTYKSEIIDRMTDAQLAVFETELEETTVRQRQRWYAIGRVYHMAADYPVFYGMFVEKFGQAEADRILKASGNA